MQPKRTNNHEKVPRILWALVAAMAAIECLMIVSDLGFVGSSGIREEVLLCCAFWRQLISGDVHYAMMKEFSRRIEHKTRQRRNRRDQDNIMFSLKRAIGSTGALSASYDSNYVPTYNGSFD